MAKFKKFIRYFVCVFILLATFAVFSLQLANWQLVKGSTFLQSANKTSISTVKMTAARGEILDSEGNGLAVNKTCYNIVFDKIYMKKDTENKTILQLTKLLAKQNEKWVDKLPITVNSKGQYAFIAGKDEEVASLKSNLRMNSYATADQCMQELIKSYEVAEKSPFDIRTIVSVRYNMEKLGFAVSTPYTFAENVSQNTVSIVSENSQILPGATIQVSTIRQYPNGSLAPHIIGTVGAISQEDYDDLKKQGKIYNSLTNVSGYALNDRIGNSGIESAFENQLRGVNGEKAIETTKTGSLASTTVTKTPSSGETVYLSLNSRIQAVLNASLANNVKGAQENGKSQGGGHQGEDCVAGAAVVLNVKDFSILATATYPSYDSNKMSDDAYLTALNNDKTTPMVNRAFNGSFMPGSSFKPMVASAALQEGCITQSSIIDCTGVYRRWDDYQPHCMSTHGPVNVITALAKSCNIFFFETGWRLGITNMDLYAKRFGLGVKTGVEIGESSGTLAGPKENPNFSATGGDVIQAAIGQSDNKFTPLQLATYAATIANNGVRLKTHLVTKVTDYSRKKVITEYKPTVMDNIGVSQANLDIVKRGMREVCLSGTASNFFGNYGYAIAAKTGTAQTGIHSDNVTFIGFAPYDKPEIAVAVVLEYGAKSKFSLTVAKDIFDAYFYHTSVNAEGKIVFPSADNSLTSSTSSGE